MKRVKWGTKKVRGRNPLVRDPTQTTEAVVKIIINNKWKTLTLFHCF